jgi:hypothetical protein
MSKLRRAITLSVMVMTVLSMSMVTAVSNADAATAEAGDLIKMEGLSSVYYLGEDGKRYVFPTENTYFSWYSDFSSVVTIPQSELESYPLGSNVTIRPGTHLVKITTDPTVYAVEEGGTLRAIPDEETAKTLYGDNWAKRVVDVPDAFFTNYTIEDNEVSADSYPQGTLVKPADSNDIYYINAEGEAQPIEDEAAFEANRFQWKFVTEAASDYNLPTEGAEITSAYEELIDPSQGTAGDTSGNEDEDTDAGSGLSVALASDTPASASLPKNVVPAFATYNFTASNDGAVELDSLKLKKIGVGDEENVGDVYLYDGSTKLTNARTISSSNNTVTFNGVDYKIDAGETKSITVRAVVEDLNDGGNHGFAIQEASAVGTNGATVSGSFPVQGNIMSFVDVTGGSVTYEYRNVANSSLKVGDTQEEVAELKIRSASGGEDVELNQITLTNEGSVNPSDLKNFKLYESGNLLAEKASTDSDALTMVLDEPLTIEEGDNETITLKADIMGGVDTNGGAIQYELDDDTDLQATGVDYGYLVGVSQEDGTDSASTVYDISIEAGELTFEVDGPSSQDVTKNAEDVNMADMTVTTAGDEDISVQALNGTIELTSTSTDHSENLSSYIENVQLVNTDEDDVYDVTKVSEDHTNYNFKVENFTIPAGESSWRVRLDFVENNVEVDDNYKFTMDASAGSDKVDAENADGETIQDVKPNTTIEGNPVTIKDATLTASAASLADGTEVANTQGVKMVKFTLEAGDAEDVKVTEVKVEATSTTNLSLPENTSNYTLVDSGDNVLESGVSASSDDTVTFTDINDGNGLVINAGETKTLYVETDLASGASTGDITLAIDNITAETADDGDAVSGDTGDVALSGRQVTVSEKGSIAFSLDSSSPEAGHIFLSNSEGNHVFSVKADASQEDIEVEDLYIAVATTSDSVEDISGAISSATLYQDGEEVKTIGTVSNDGDNYLLKFDNINKVVSSDEDSIFKLEVNMAGIGSGAEDTAESAFGFNAKMATTSLTGVSSNKDFVATSTDTANLGTDIETIASQDNYVYASKVIAAKAGMDSTTFSNGDEKDAMKFTLTPDTNDSKDAILGSTTVSYSFSGSGRIATGTTDGAEAYLYSGSQLLATSTVAEENNKSGEVNFDIGAVGDNDTISADGETYTVKFDITGADADDKLTTSISVNGGSGNDGITWKDYSDGEIVSWIDLGEDVDTTKIEQTLEY